MNRQQRYQIICVYRLYKKHVYDRDKGNTRTHRIVSWQLY